MRKHLLLFLPLAAILLSACSQGYSLEMIQAYYVTNTDKVLNAEGEDIRVKVSSTHSYVMSAEPAGAMEFRNNGVVPYTQEGIAIVDLEHEVMVNPNNSADDRRVYFIARQRRNQDIVTTLEFVQPGQLKVSRVDDPNAVLSADGETVRIRVSSTQPYVMTSVPAEACSFANAGIVDFKKEGPGFDEQVHDVQVNRNESADEREIRIYVSHRDNQQIITSITLRQNGRGTEK